VDKQIISNQLWPRIDTVQADNVLSIMAKDKYRHEREQVSPNHDFLYSIMRELRGDFFLA
jgi:hypothetical protein